MSGSQDSSIKSRLYVSIKAIPKNFILLFRPLVILLLFGFTKLGPF